ncbi:MAG TPA: hypothetical protein PK264_03235 [Hyphomicrobiaceae bacterium]|nr:hypothetical protein [Hyphomicrobiaceae bacterium]
MKSVTKPMLLAASGLALALGLLALPASETVARERLTVDEGLARCTAWCGAHNRSGSKKFWQCYGRCEVYWKKNGSDAKH